MYLFAALHYPFEGEAVRREDRLGTLTARGKRLEAPAAAAARHFCDAS
jgi:hypothetical protein